MQRYTMAASTAWVISGRWNVHGRLGLGSSSVVYNAIDVHSQENVVVKIGTGESGYWDILNEGAVYQALRAIFPAHRGFPRVYSCQLNVRGSAIIVMERLGSNLDDLLREHIAAPHGMFPRDDLLEIGAQIVRHLRDLHFAGFIHRDIHPRNIVVGGGSVIRAYLIDLGVAKNILGRSRDPRGYGSNRNLSTNAFSSLALHRGNEAGRRDDLESLGYCLLYLFNGTLPWLEGANQRHGNNLTHFLRSAVSHVRLSKLCDGLGVWMQRYMYYLRRLEFSQDPDYVYLIRCLRNAKSH